MPMGMTESDPTRACFPKAQKLMLRGRVASYPAWLLAGLLFLAVGLSCCIASSSLLLLLLFLVVVDDAATSSLRWPPESCRRICTLVDVCCKVPPTSVPICDVKVFSTRLGARYRLDRHFFPDRPNEDAVGLLSSFPLSLLSWLYGCGCCCGA